MIDQCLPADRALHDDLVLWVELWLRSAARPGAAAGRRAPLRAPARVVRAGDRRRRRRAASCATATSTQMTDRLLALIDGYGIRVLTGDPRDAARARARGDLGGGRGRPRPVLGRALIAQRFALGVGQRPRRAVLAGRRPRVAPALTTSAPPTVSIVSRVRTPGRARARRARSAPRPRRRGARARGGSRRHVGDLERGTGSRRAQARVEPRLAHLAHVGEQHGGVRRARWRRGRAPRIGMRASWGVGAAAGGVGRRRARAASRRARARPAGAPTRAAPRARRRRGAASCAGRSRRARRPAARGVLGVRRSASSRWRSPSARTLGQHGAPAALELLERVAQLLGVHRLAPRVDPHPPHLAVGPRLEVEVGGERGRRGSSWRREIASSSSRSARAAAAKASATTSSLRVEVVVEQPEAGARLAA